MTCKTCQEHRAAILKAWQDRQFADALARVVDGARDIVKGKRDD